MALLILHLSKQFLFITNIFYNCTICIPQCRISINKYCTSNMHYAWLFFFEHYSKYHPKHFLIKYRLFCEVALRGALVDHIMSSFSFSIYINTQLSVLTHMFLFLFWLQADCLKYFLVTRIDSSLFLRLI